MKSIAEFAIHLNNEGVHQFFTGQEQKALSLLTESLSILKSQLAEYLNLYRGSEDESFDNECTSRALHIVTSPSTYPSRCASGDSSSIFHIYSQFMIIPSGQQPQHPKYIPIYVACVVLNLALLYHRLGSTQGNELYTMKAFKMYGLVLKVLSYDVVRNDQMALCIQIVAVNNLAQLHQDSYHYDEAMMYIQHLSQLVERVPRSSTPLILSDSDISKFEMNVMLCSHQTPIAAPAA